MSVRFPIIVLAALLLANCGSSPKTQYFTLAPVSASEHRVTIPTPVTVAAVHVPPALDRREMVRRTGANSVDIREQDRWTAPLGDMIREVLARDLAARLPQDKVVIPQSPAPPHTAQIVVSVAQFGPDATGKVVLDGDWSLLDGDREKLVLRRQVALETAARDRSADGQAAAMSQLVGQLAQDIATTLGQRLARHSGEPMHRPSDGRGSSSAAETMLLDEMLLKQAGRSRIREDHQRPVSDGD